MKKFLTLVLTVIMVMSAASAFAADIKVLVNGEEVQFDRGPEKDGDTVLIPYRFVMEKLGAKVSWHQETKTVFSEYSGSIITTQINNDLMFVNNEVYNLEKAPSISTDRTLVTFDVIKNAVGAEITWDEATSTVTITK